MMKSKAHRILLLFGGNSGEHEISIRSANSVFEQLDRNHFEVVLVGINRKNEWFLQKPGQSPSLALESNAHPVVLLPATPEKPARLHDLTLGSHRASIAVDAVFSVIHGTFGEDGTLQGLLEAANVPYVGAGVLGSAIGMDKDIAKRLVQAAGIPVVPFFTLRKPKELHSICNEIHLKIERELQYPVFVKPANSGSSVGVHSVHSREELKPALLDAFSYDVKILIEAAVKAREIECAVLESSEFGAPPRVSPPGEITPTHEFYSYEAKYLDEKGAKLLIPAPLSEVEKSEAQNFAAQIFEVLQCTGMARVDLFLERSSGKFFFNEINTAPGFTSISMYPKLWEHAGLSYPALLTELIERALTRWQLKNALRRDFPNASQKTPHEFSVA